MTLTLSQISYFGIVLVAVGSGVAAFFSVSSHSSPARVAYRRYLGAVAKELRALQMPHTPQSIAMKQGAAAALQFVIAAWWRDGLFLITGLATLALPIVILRSRRKKRVQKIDTQIDGWLLALSNALKATPSLGEALESSASLTQAPLSEEIEVAIKELSLGSPMVEALHSMAERIGSATMWGAIATLQVARNTGGNVPQILEEAAATLREMERLEAVVRTKTADGRSQAFVLAFMPFIVVAGIHFIDPNWLQPLTESATGLMVLGIAASLWIAGFLVARKVLAVDV